MRMDSEPGEAAAKLRAILARSRAADRETGEALEAKPAPERARFYRKRATEIRGLLAQMKDPQARALIEQTITNYEHLASLVDKADARPH